MALLRAPPCVAAVGDTLHVSIGPLRIAGKLGSINYTLEHFMSEKYYRYYCCVIPVGGLIEGPSITSGAGN